MSQKRIGIDDMVGEIEGFLNGFGDDVYNEVKKDAEKIASSAVKELKSSSPVDEGKYAAGWSYTKEHTPYAVGVTIYNKSKPSLTHLLENGHVLKRNGAVIGHVKALPHIAAVEQRVIEEFEKQVKEGLSK